MKNILLTVLILLLSSLSPSRAAADKQYAFQQISMRNGLSYFVRCLAVSHEKGYVWIGTKSGIGRFDGYELKKYLHDNITHIIEDKEHTIWAITPKGLFYYNYQKDEFLQARDSDNNPVVASSICLWTDGVLFGGSGRLYKYDYASHQIKFLCSLISNTKHNITHLQKWDEQTVLCTDRWSHALLVNTATGRARPAPFESKDHIATLIDSKGNIWVAPYHQGVKCYDRNGKLLHSYQTQNSSLRTNVVLSLAECNGQIWIGTDGEGIYILNPENDAISVLSHIPGDPYSLPTNSILYLYADSNNDMWAGSVRGGLISIKEVGMKFYSDALPGIEYGLSEKTILSLYQGDEENIWIGTDGGGINSFNPITKKFHHVLPSWGNKIASIAGVDKARLLVSLFNKGVFFFDKQTERYQPLNIVNDSINSYLCQQGRAVNLFQNTAETILLLSDLPYSYNLIRKEFIPISLDKRTKDIIGVLLPIYSSGSVSYLHDFKHIYRMDARNNKLQTLHSCKGDTVINSVSADENGTFWIGSNYGLSYYSAEKKKHADIPNSLINEVNSVICDKRGRVWIGTNDKLFAHLIDEGEFILYGEPDGVVPNEYIEKPRLLSMQGDIYMGSVNGLLCINKQLPEDSTTPPVLELADVLVGGERMNSLITGKRSLEVEEQSRPISIKIIAHNKEIFRKPIYRYTLRGMEGQVTYSYLPELTLSGLPSGTYQVMAACTTRTGGWTDDYQIMKLIVLPPWYKSGWFISCCILLIVSCTGFIFFLLLRRKENKLKWKLKEHEQQVYEEKVRFLININHELRTPLTLIHAPLKQLLESLSPNDDKYQIIESISRQSGRMKKLLNMVLDVRKMEVGQSTLNVESVELNPWIEQLIADFRPEAKMKNISMIYQAEKEVEALCFDKEKCTTILTNLLINALKYSSENQQIRIATRLSDDKTCIRISVSDQGPGLKDVDINSLFTRFYQGNNSRPGTGIGLSYSKILIEQHGGSIGTYDHGDMPGATFWFELPKDVLPGKVTLQPQPYLNELLASTQETESTPDGVLHKEDTLSSTLLIVDDNKDLTEYLSTALKKHFKEIRTAYDGEEALAICRKAHPDAIVSDIQMPRMNGYELCKQVKEDLEISHVPIILLTARNDEESQIFGYKNGADAYLTKPFEVNVLYNTIYSQLKNRERMKVRYASADALPQPQESTFSAADEDFLYRLNKVLSENLDNAELGVPFFCTELGVSRASLYKKLKALTGMGASDYINKIRIERAIQLLTHSSLSITEIADQTGFSTSRYFSTIFKQCVGCSPTQYREEHNLNMTEATD